jgi:PIN domain nuclease of toxin-antitoxin system
VKYLLDSHTVDWARQEDPRLSARVKKILSDTRPGDLAISDVTLTELARHLTKGTIKVTNPHAEWLEGATQGLVVLPVSIGISLLAAQIVWTNRDPCDRHIVATAVVHELPLITIDESIHALRHVSGLKVIW